MSNQLFFNFSVDKENNSILIKREFDANLELVWQAWTQPELLDQWWAPRPYHIETKVLDLKINGMWLYAMVSPENEKMWCRADYKNIETNQLLQWLDTFCDENGVENNIKPRSFWTTVFEEVEGKTFVNITLKHENLEEIEAMIQMGFKEGFTMAVGNLDELLASLSEK